MRRLAIALVALGAVLALAGPARAQTSTPPVDVIELSGLIDRANADFLERALERAATDGSQALVIQLNSKGATVSDERMAELADAIADSPVLVGIWVGPSGAAAQGAAGQLLAAAAVTGMAPGSRLGNLGEPLPARTPLEFGAATARLRDGTMGATEARDSGALKPGVNDTGTPTLGDFVVVLDGVTYRGAELDTAEVVVKDGEPRRQLLDDLSPRSYKLDLVPRLFHTVASPPVAYLLMTIGLSLLVFEFFTAGVGIAGGVGAVCVVLGSYGLAELPTRWWAFGLLLLSILAFAVDVQTGVPRFWTGVGVVGFVVASVFLYDGLQLSWITLLVAIIGVLLTYLVGMPSMVRTRFATPTIGREWMVGEAGTAVTDVDPEGIVTVRGAQWRARTNRSTPVTAGGPITVIAIDGVTLEVAPEGGAARDYRERARNRGAAPAGTASTASDA